MLWSALQDARKNKRNLSSLWLDIANAYGSIPHRLIFFALERYGVPAHWISVVKTYYSGIFSKSFSTDCPSNWHQHLRGIFQGCTLSIILFLVGMNVVIEYVLSEPVKEYAVNSTKLPLIRAFMDDLNLLACSVPAASTLLLRCSTAFEWAGIEF